jgi:hypothetical protein
MYTIIEPEEVLSVDELWVKEKESTLITRLKKGDSFTKIISDNRNCLRGSLRRSLNAPMDALTAMATNYFLGVLEYCLPQQKI